VAAWQTEVAHGNEGGKQEPTRVPRKEGRTVRGVVNAAPCRYHASMAHVGPTIDGVRRARSDSNSESVARSPGTGAMSNWVFQLLPTTSGQLLIVTLFFLLFPF
jgi:hypothetical protein